MAPHTDTVIKDSIFDNRGPIPQEVLQSVAIRGGATHIDDALSRNGWDRKSLVACPIVTTDQDAGKVVGSRWCIRGDISSCTVKATSVWAQADKDIKISWKLKGSDFLFSGRDSETPANFSDWYDVMFKFYIMYFRVKLHG